MVSTVKREYAAKEQELESQIRKAVQREQIARDIEINYKKKVAREAKRITVKARKSAEQEYRRKAAKAESEYREKRDVVYGITIGSLLYSFFATILTACNSPRFVEDFSAFASFLWELISRPVLLAIEACRTVWIVKDMIHIQILNVMIAVILVILVFVLVNGLIYGLIGFIVHEAARFYHEEFWDLISGVVALISLSILVWFADALIWISWNLVLVWMLIHCSYILIRMMISGSKRT